MGQLPSGSTILHALPLAVCLSNKPQPFGYRFHSIASSFYEKHFALKLGECNSEPAEEFPTLDKTTTLFIY